MSETTLLVEDIQAYWNRRAGLGQWAGTRDILAKRLEIEALASHVRGGMSIVDVGCGNGITAIELARRFDVKVTGLDYAEEMIRSATAMADQESLKGAVVFSKGDVNDLSRWGADFDLAYTERTLINLVDWPAQKRAIESICRLLKPGGVFVMCENSQDGLELLNSYRGRVGLPVITPPWHNRYFRDQEIAEMRMVNVTLEACQHYSSTYYFLSRVVNAALAAQAGCEPDYESPINQLALKLPSFGECGQGRIWLWRKAAASGKGA
jgi:ubiquinone/menaquinone biosynthesis C-methylase UbiE